MKKSTPLFFTFIFSFIVLSVQTGKGTGFDIYLFSESSIVSQPEVKDAKEANQAKAKNLDSKILNNPIQPANSSDVQVSKTVNVGMELTKALFGKYLKKIN